MATLIFSRYFLAVFSHEPTPSASVTQTASVIRVVKAASMRALPSVAKEAQVMLDLIDLVQRRS
jgi:hypothetical protein